MALETVFEDDRLIAVSKPAGQLMIPGRGPGPGLPLRQEVEAALGRKVFVVHRLDRDASGLAVFAKDAASHRSLCLAFEGRTVKKTYLAVVVGEVKEDGVVEAPLRPFGSGRMGVGQPGKASTTDYRVLRRLKGATLLEVQPRTGRRHQIRVHLYSIGHPILGDPLYGQERPVGGAPRLMLHALELAFSEGGFAGLSLRAEPPEDFAKTLARASA